MSMIILLKYYIKVVWFFKYNFGEQFQKNIVFLLAKGSVLWYNKYRTKKGEIIMEYIEITQDADSDFYTFMEE